MSISSAANCDCELLNGSRKNRQAGRQAGKQLGRQETGSLKKCSRSQKFGAELRAKMEEQFVRRSNAAALLIWSVAV